MIADWDTDALQDHEKRIRVRGVRGLIITLERPGAPLSLSEQLDRSLGFTDKDSCFIIVAPVLEYHSKQAS